MNETDIVVASGCVNLRQGDAVDLPRIVLLAGNSDGFRFLPTPLGVAVLSQTCDVIQPSKALCAVAPIIDADAEAMANARKGRRPLHLYLMGDTDKAILADMSYLASVPKTCLEGHRILHRVVPDPSSVEAADVAYRIGRLFTRFAFPDEVYPAFQKLREEAQHRTGIENSPLGYVLDHIDDLRVSADQWSKPGRHLRLLIVVRQEHMDVLNDADPAQAWSSASIKGLLESDKPSGLTLNRTCELIMISLKSKRPAAAVLWDRFGELLQAQLLEPYLNEAVKSFGVVVLSDGDLTYRQYKGSASLDLEVLSDGQGQR